MYAVFMAYIEGYACDHGLLLLALVDDYVAMDSPVRSFVADFDLGDAGLHRSQPKATGRRI